MTYSTARKLADALEQSPDVNHANVFGISEQGEHIYDYPENLEQTDLPQYVVGFHTTGDGITPEVLDILGTVDFDYIANSRSHEGAFRVFF